MKVWTTNILSLQQRLPSQESDCHASFLGTLRIMKLSSAVSTGFTFSVSCFLIFLLYVHFTSQNVHIHMSSHAVSSLQSQEHQQIVNDFVKNLNASIRRMDFDQEYTLRNLSKANDDEMNLNIQAGEEEEDGQNPLFLDVMKIARLTAKRKGLPDAANSHDLSGYVSILHPGQTQINLHCNTCSLVSSSGHLLHSKLGTTIDSADCVFRMNDAPSRGYSKDVGARTSLRMVGFQAVPKVLKKKGSLLLGSTRPRYLAMWGPQKELSSNGTGSGYNYLKALAMQLEQQGTECFILSNEEMTFNDKMYEAETGRDSSSQILHSYAGPAIDADRSCVFRMNTAPTIHFEQDVGAKTTVRVLAHASVSGLFRSQKDLLGHPNATRFLIAWGPDRYMKPGGTSHRRLKGLAGSYRNVDFYIASQEEMEYADLLFEKETGRPRSKSGSWLTTGWFTMILARSVCNEIHVYGMVGENYCKHDHGKKHPYHYYNPHSQDECEYYQSMERAYHGGHRFMTEKAIFASWAKLTPKIYFHQPEWD